jgi:hypothetical protein
VLSILISFACSTLTVKAAQVQANDAMMSQLDELTLFQTLIKYVFELEEKGIVFVFGEKERLEAQKSRYEQWIETDITVDAVYIQALQV